MCSDTPTNVDALKASVAALEARIMHQDATIEDLNAAVTAQWQHIDRLQRQIASLVERVQDLRGVRGEEGPEPPPPHY